MATMIIVLGVVLMIIFCALTAFATYVWLQLKRSRDVCDNYEDVLIDNHAEYFNEYLDKLQPTNKKRAG
jgi:hypothetical protein